ncbi:MAG TPA: hypothetical protein VGP94_10965, partial [Tepidisphaeraceae bacterium]|nr:hypothetical protein [Tepidisphaeraceae bacterium]
GRECLGIRGRGSRARQIGRRLRQQFSWERDYQDEPAAGFHSVKGSGRSSPVRLFFDKREKERMPV